MSVGGYTDILYLQRPISKRYRMDIGHRAKQFAPFAALRGFEEAVQKEEGSFSVERAAEMIAGKNDESFLT